MQRKKSAMIVFSERKKSCQLSFEHLNDYFTFNTDRNFKKFFKKFW